MKQQSKKTSKRENIAASFFEDLLQEEVELPAFLSNRAAVEAVSVPTVKVEQVFGEISPQVSVVETENQTKQNKTEQDKTKQHRTKQAEKQGALQTAQNQTKPNTTLDKHPNKTEQNKTEQNNAEDLVLALNGVRKQVVASICEVLLERNVDEIQTNYRCWAELAQVNYNSIKTTVRALRLDGYFEIEAPKGGRGALITVKVNKDLLIAFSKHQTKLNKKLNILLNKDVSSSGSSIYSAEKKETTNSELPVDFVEIQTPESVKRVGFGLSHVRQVVKAGLLSADDLQDSLNHFAYDLEAGSVNAKTGALNFLLGILVKRGSKYTSSAYLAAEEREIAEHLAKVQAQEALLTKAREEIFHVRFREWLGQLAEETRKEILAPVSWARGQTKVEEETLKKHFRESVFEQVP